jgi:hypothetical protein
MPVRDLLSAASTQGGAPADPYFYDVSLLLNGDGTNGAQNNTFLDSSTNNFTITRNGNTTQGSFSPYGTLWSNYFTTGNYLTAPNSSAFQMGSGDFTIEAWIFPTATAGSSGSEIISYGASGQFDGWHFYQLTSTNYLGFGLNYAGVIVSSSAALTLNQWTHVAVTRSGTTFKLWINGVNDGTATSSTSQSTNGSDLLYLGTGSYSQGADRSFIGYISNARVVKGVVVYTTTFTPSTTPLTAISGTSILTCQSNRFIDNSSNAFTITVNGSPSVQRFSPFNPTAPYSTSVIGGSGYFDGSGDYLSIAQVLWSANGNATFEGWIYATSYSNQKEIFNTSGQGDFCINTNGTLRLHVADNNYKDTSGTITLNAWTHVAVVQTASNRDVFINGVLQTYSTTVGSPNTAAWNTPSGTFNIGYAGLYRNDFVGYMGNVRITNTAVYTATFTPPTAPVTAISGTLLLANCTNAGIPDFAMQNNLETVGNAQVSTSVKKYGTGSISFDGSGDYLSSNPPTTDLYAFGTGDFTIEFWIYFNSTASVYIVYDTRPSGGNGLYPTLVFDSSTTCINYFTNSSTRITGNITTASSSWNHIALCRSGTSTKLFVNGNQSGSTYTDSNAYLGATNRPIIGGDGNSLGSNGLNGYLDDLRITKGYARYTTTFTPPTAALPTY